ncbi:MAG: hypothetical protein R2761_11110 [Acidimicrobiales bacterium]
MTVTARTGQPAFRELLCLLAAGVSTAAMVELALIAHWHGRTQALAWVAAWAGLTAAWLVSGPSGPRRLRAARALAAMAVMIGAIGAVVHLDKNLAFATELHPERGLASRMADAAQGGLPLLAPGSLALPGLLVALAAWRHPDDAPSAPPTGATGAGPIPSPTGRAEDIAGERENGVFGRPEPALPEWTEWPGPGRWGNLVASAVAPAGAPEAGAAARTAGTPVEEREHRGLSADRGGGPGPDPADHPEPTGEAQRLDPADEP